MKKLQLFAALRKIREFERLQLTFLKSMVDFDIILEIGYAQEQRKPLTPKQLPLLGVAGSATTIRRRLAKLTEQGVVKRTTDANDRRSEILTLSLSSLKVLGRYGSLLGISV